MLLTQFRCYLSLGTLSGPLCSHSTLCFQPFLVLITYFYDSLVTSLYSSLDFYVLWRQGWGLKLLALWLHLVAQTNQTWIHVNSKNQGRTVFQGGKYQTSQIGQINSKECALGLAARRSLVILLRISSVQWWELKADWVAGEYMGNGKKKIACMEYSFSRHKWTVGITLLLL